MSAKFCAEFSDLLAIPNLASDQANIRAQRRPDRGHAEEARPNDPATHARRRAADRGRRPRGAASAKRTIAFYAHYDGQPVDPVEVEKRAVEAGHARPRGKATSTGATAKTIDPEWRLYARSCRRRQGADHRDRGRARRARGQRGEAGGQSAFRFRRRGRSGLASPRGSISRNIRKFCVRTPGCFATVRFIKAGRRNSSSARAG